MNSDKATYRLLMKRAGIMLLPLLVIWLALQAFAQTAAPSQVFDIGTDRQLFIDNTMIAKSRGVTLTMNPAQKTGERNVTSDSPWEDFYVQVNTVIDDQGVYKMWYDASSWPDDPKAEGRHQCYATSTDGIHWEKPQLGLVNFKGSKANNIVLDNSMGTVFMDPQKSDGNGYKYVGWWDKKTSPGLWLFTSPDGIHWSQSVDHAILTKGQFDTQNEAFWDDGIQKWVAYVRRWAPLKDNRTDLAMTDAQITADRGIRKIGRSETKDLAHWPEPTIVFSADAKDPEVSDHYTPVVIKYAWAPHAYFMFPSPYYHYPNKQNDGPVDIQMAAGRDSIHWNRIDRHPYVRLGLRGSDEGGSMYMGIGMIQKGDEIWMYYSGFDFTHGAYKREASRHKGFVSRLVQRMDGFVSADAAYEGGELTTVPLKFNGHRLLLNVDTGALGFVRVELLDQQGRPIPGFGAKDSERIDGNYIHREVSWNGKSDLSALAGKVVQLHFVMRSTKLYSYQLAE